MCQPDKWNSIESSYDHSWGLLNKFGESSIYILYLTNVSFLFVSDTVRSTILPEQEGFLERIFEISFEERSWKKLVNLDTLHAFCGGPVPF